MGDNQTFEVTEKVGRKLKQAREKSNLSQADIAKKAGINANYYARIERGEVNPSLEIIHNIIKALGIKSSNIFSF